MPFGNPLAAGLQLIREDLQSDNFVTGVSGWSIFRNGNAEFNNVTIRGGVTEDGTGLYYNGTPGAGTLFLTISATAGVDSFGTAYPAGVTLFNASVQVGNWTSSGFSVNSTTGTGIASLQPSGSNVNSPELFISGKPAASSVLGGLVAIYNNATSNDQIFLYGPVNLAAVDANVSRAWINMLAGAATDGATGYLAWNDNFSGGNPLQWGQFGITAFGTIQGVEPGHVGAGIASAAPWHPVAGNIGYQNNWTDFGGTEQTVRFRIDASRRVWLDGDAKPGAGSYVNGNNLFAMPAGYRPVNDRAYGMVPTANGTGTGSFTLNVRAAGNVQVENILGATPAVVGLSGISWPVD
jgi:hypothetical protein